MKRAGCSLAILGVVLCGASFVMFGTSIFRAMAAHEVAAGRIDPGGAWSSGPLTVDTEKYVQVAVRGHIRSTHAKRGTGDDDWDLQYAFPLRYEVFDGRGGVVHQEARDFASDGGAHSITNERVTADGGSARIEQGFDKFQVAPPGELRVEASLGEDADFGATIESAEVVVFDNVSKHGARVGIGVATLVVGGGIAMLGVVLLIIGAAKGNRG